MRFWAIVAVSLGLAAAIGLGLAQVAGGPARHLPSAQPVAGGPPPNPQPDGTSEPQEISHEEMVKEQERRDREAEAERDRDDQ